MSEAADIAIGAQGLGKKYFIGRPKHDENTMLRDRIAEGVVSAGRSIGSIIKGQKKHVEPSDELWAVQDLTFDIKQGEKVGIIGRNGAGKSTLLKLLSRITEPTTGSITLNGRVSSLLEVGTGFHPELTGRENIYLNGSVLGMSRAEIRGKFDEIVDFAEVERFLDLPVKRYSSGMYVRLAFSVAAHLEPDILIVDEVLSVGDVRFQKKCLGRIGRISREGRTVLFVSHNMASVLALCSRAMILDHGRIVKDGPVRNVVDHYLSEASPVVPVSLHERKDRDGDGTTRFTTIKIDSLDPDGIVRSNSRIRIRLGYDGPDPVRRPRFVVSVYDSSDVGIFALDSEAVGIDLDELPHAGMVECITDPINLTAGRCTVNVHLLKGGVSTDYVKDASRFDVESVDFFGTGKEPDRNWVMCMLPNQWSYQKPDLMSPARFAAAPS